MAVLYGRQIEVAVAGFTIREPRISLELEREIDTTQSKGKVDIYNLSASNEERIRERGESITVSAGYPQTFAQIFSGEVQRVTRVREQLARITRIHLGDQVRQKNRVGGVTVRSYEGPVSVRQITMDLAADLKLPLGPLDAIPESATYENFYWASSTDAGMTALLRSVNCRWFERDGVIRINRAGTVQADAPTISISPRNGLIESPIVTDEGIAVKSFLNANIILGCRINLRSATVNGSYKVVALAHIADNWSGRFITTAEMRELQ